MKNNQIDYIDLRRKVSRLGWSLSIMIGALLIFTIIYYSIYDTLWSFGEKASIVIGSILESISYMGGFFLAAFLYYVFSRKYSTEPIRVTPKLPNYLPLIVLSAIGICFAAATVNDWFCSLIGYSLPDDELMDVMSDPEIFALYMTLSLSPAFAEELLFRGVVYANLRPLGRSFAVISSAVLFAFMHMNIGQFFYTMVAGIIMALLYEMTGSIWGGVILHMFNNLFGVLQNTIIYRVNEVYAAIWIYLLYTLIIFCGFVSTICLLRIYKKQSCYENCRAQSLPNSTEYILDAHQTPISFSEGIKILIKAPGMLFYIILTLSIALLNIIVY